MRKMRENLEVFFMCSYSVNATKYKQGLRMIIECILNGKILMVTNNLHKLSGRLKEDKT